MRGVNVSGDALVRFRKSKGLTQEVLAQMAGIDVKTVRRAEQGKRLDLGTLTKIGFALETNLSHLIRPSRSAQELEICRRDIVLKWHRFWDAQDMEPLMALYHDEAALRLPGAPQIPFGGTFHGKEEIRRAHEIAWSTCRTGPVTSDDFSLFVCDDSVILDGKKAIHLPDGSVARLSCTQIFTFEIERIIDQRVEYDTLKFAQLLQLPPADQRAEEREQSSR